MMNTREALLRSAKELAQPSASAADAYAAVADTVAAAVTRELGDRPDLERLIGPGNADMMADNHRNHVRFISSQLVLYQPDVLVETVCWVLRAYRSHGFQLTYWSAQLNSFVDHLRDGLAPEHFEEIYPFYNWMIVNQPLFALASEEERATPWG